MGFDAYVAVCFFFFRIGIPVVVVWGLSSRALLRDPLWAWGFAVVVILVQRLRSWILLGGPVIVEVVIRLGYFPSAIIRGVFLLGSVLRGALLFALSLVAKFLHWS